MAKRKRTNNDKVCHWPVGGVHGVLRFPPPIKLTAIIEILLKVALRRSLSRKSRIKSEKVNVLHTFIIKWLEFQKMLITGKSVCTFVDNIHINLVERFNGINVNLYNWIVDLIWKRITSPVIFGQDVQLKCEFPSHIKCGYSRTWTGGPRYALMTINGISSNNTKIMQVSH
jgi:hypothetical protein